MKNIFTQSIIFFIFILSIQKTQAQLASGIPFLFTASTPSVAAVTTTNIILAIRPAGIQDEFDTLIAPGGFNYNFEGVNYRNFIVSSNGWIALTNSPPPNVPASVPNPLPNNSLSTNSTGFPIIAPLWDDDNCGLIQYGVTSNTLTVKWTVKWDKTDTSAYTALMWVSLNGNTGVITMNYSSLSYAASPSASASIGIAGVCTGDFYSVTPDINVPASAIDSVNEDTSINVKPINAKFVFTPYCANDDCANAKFLGTIDSTCTPYLASTFNSTSSGTANCGTTDTNDVWFSYYKPVGISRIIIKTTPTLCDSARGTSIEVYSGSCGSSVIGCSQTGVAYPQYADVYFARSAAVAETLLVRVTSDNNKAGKFYICAVAVETGDSCANATPVNFPLPFNDSQNTGVFGNNYSNQNSVCQSDYLTGQDYVYSYTPPVDECVNAVIDGTALNSYPGLFVLDGCPDDTLNSHCIASATNISDGDSIMNMSLMGNHTYYFIVDNDSLLSGMDSISFNFHLSDAGITCSLLNVLDIQRDLFLNIYPNPIHSGEKLFMENSHTGDENGLIEIVNITGKILFSGKITNTDSVYEIPVSQLSQGIYFVRMISGKNILNRKLVIE